MKVKEYFVLSDAEFNQLVEDKLGLEYECVAEGEWNNDSSYTFNDIKASHWPNNLWKEGLFKALDKQNLSGVSVDTLLEYMVHGGQLEEGNYLISVCW